MPNPQNPETPTTPSQGKTLQAFLQAARQMASPAIQAKVEEEMFATVSKALGTGIRDRVDKEIAAYEKDRWFFQPEGTFLNATRYGKAPEQYQIDRAADVGAVGTLAAVLGEKQHGASPEAMREAIYTQALAKLREDLSALNTPYTHPARGGKVYVKFYGSQDSNGYANDPKNATPFKFNEDYLKEMAALLAEEATSTKKGQDGKSPYEKLRAAQDMYHGRPPKQQAAGSAIPGEQQAPRTPAAPMGVAGTQVR